MKGLPIHEQYQTPADVIQYMISMVPGSARTILEPSPGMGGIVSALRNKGSYEVHTPADFFLLPRQRYDCIIMNPPFSEKSCIMDNAPEDIKGKQIKGMRIGYYFLQQCMEMSDHVIALMPCFTICDSDVRMRFLKSWGMKSLTGLPRKTFEYARIQTCVFELEKGYTGATEFRVYDLLPK